MVEDEAELDALRAARREDRYVTIDEIARGGMGRVVQVWDRVVQRRVAMKVLRPEDTDEGSGDSRRTVSRFLREARITGQIPHPGVVPIHDIEVTRGQVSFTMSLIEGRTFEQAFGDGTLETGAGQTTRAILALLAVCDVMSYAHAHDVIHRDLKPANIMVGSFGEIYVVDWGLAKVLPGVRHAPGGGDEEPAGGPTELDEDFGSGVQLANEYDTPDAGQTLDGSVVGTPSFMSPEQAEGRVGDVGPLSDVYSVGAILYRVLAGRNPYASLDEKNDPRTIIDMVRSGPPTPILRLRPKAPPELVSICEKAMARNPADRYTTMGELAEDLRAFLDGRVVAAYEEGPVAGLKKLVLRNRALSGAIAAAVLAVGGSMLVVTLVHASLNSELEDKNEQLELARTTAEASAARAVETAAEAERLRRAAERDNYAVRVSNAAERIAQDDLITARRRLDGIPSDLRGWESDYLRALMEGSLATWERDRAPGADSAPPTALALAGDGRAVALGHADGQVTVRGVPGGEVVAEGACGAVSILSIAPWGDGWAVACADGDLSGWRDGERTWVVEGPEGVTSVSFADGRLVLGTLEGAVLGYELPEDPGDSGQAELVELARLDDEVVAVDLHASGLLAATTSTGPVRIVPLEGGRELTLGADSEGSAPELRRLAFSRDGSRLATGSASGEVRVWRTTDGSLLQVDRAHRAPVTALAPGGDDTSFTSGGMDGLVVARQALRDPVRLRGHDHRVTAIAHLPGLGRLISSSQDHTARLWDARGCAAEVRVDTLGTSAVRVDFGPGGQQLAVGAVEGFVLTYEARLGTQLDQVWCQQVLSDLVWLPSGLLAVATVDDRPLLYRLDGGGVLELAVAGGVEQLDSALVMAEVGDELALAARDGSLTIREPNGPPRPAFGGEGSPPVALAGDPRGRWLVASFADNRLRVVDVKAGDERTLTIPGAERVEALALHPAEDLLAWGDSSGRVGIVTLGAAAFDGIGPREEPRGGGGPDGWSVEAHNGAVRALCWVAAGTRLASGSSDGTARIFWPPLEEALLVFDYSERGVHDIHFDETTQRLAVVAGSSVYLYGPAGEEPAGAATPDQGESALAQEELRERLERARSFQSERLSASAWSTLVEPDRERVAYEQALELVKRVELLDPSAPGVGALTGAALLRLGRSEEALSWLRGIESEGRSGGARQQLLIALALARLGRDDEARAARGRHVAQGGDPVEAALAGELERELEGTAR